LNETIRSAVRLSEPAYGAVEIRTRLAHDLPEWAADAEQIRRLLNNLLKNAAEAARTHGWIEVRTAYEPSPVPCIVLEVSDNGEGMDEETLQKALTPYFTTKQRGTGLGLAIVEKIAKDHDGELALKSEKGKGTTVCIRFRAG
jgi:two-component system NtrC family sensor kinase